MWKCGHLGIWKCISLNELRLHVSKHVFHSCCMDASSPQISSILFGHCMVKLKRNFWISMFNVLGLQPASVLTRLLGCITCLTLPV